MKKLFGAVFVALVAMTFVGCGKPKIPANTVAAGYVDLDKSIDGAFDLAEMVVSHLPDDLKKDADKRLDEFVDQYKKNFRQFQFDWAVYTVGKGKDLSDFEWALVVKCKYDKKGDDGNLKEALQKLKSWESDTKWGCDILISHDAAVAFVEEKYVIAARDVDVLYKMVSLYKDGEGETSDAFDDLTDIGGDTVARFQTADVGTLVDIFGVRGTLEDFGRNCDDEDLVEDILDIGAVTFDFSLSGDTVGSRLTVDAGTKDFARCLEGLFLWGKLANRVTADAVVGFGNYMTVLEACLPRLVRRDLSVAEKMDTDTAKSLGKMLRGALDVDRSGTTVEVSYEINVEDLVELLVPVLTK